MGASRSPILHIPDTTTPLLTRSSPHRHLAALLRDTNKGQPTPLRLQCFSIPAEWGEQRSLWKMTSPWPGRHRPLHHSELIREPFADPASSLDVRTERCLCFPFTTSNIELCPRKHRMKSPSAERTLSPPPVLPSTTKYSNPGTAVAKRTCLQETWTPHSVVLRDQEQSADRTRRASGSSSLKMNKRKTPITVPEKGQTA